MKFDVTDDGTEDADDDDCVDIADDDDTDDGTEDADDDDTDGAGALPDVNWFI